jgi:Uma2 family endonuclease
LVQGRLRDLLKRMAALGSYIETNLPYRALPEYELRVADVGYVSSERWSTIDVEDYVPGAPDLVIEVLSPSNSVAEMIEREQLCLENGAQEFWVVDPKRRLVKVSTPDGHTRTWKSGQQIPLPLFAGKALPVDDIFS